jgi:hypothetical protein
MDHLACIADAAGSGTDHWADQLGEGLVGIQPTGTNRAVIKPQACKAPMLGMIIMPESHSCCSFSQCNSLSRLFGLPVLRAQVVHGRLWGAALLLATPGTLPCNHSGEDHCKNWMMASCLVASKGCTWMTFIFSGHFWDRTVDNTRSAPDAVVLLLLGGSPWAHPGVKGAQAGYQQPKGPCRSGHDNDPAGQWTVANDRCLHNIARLFTSLSAARCRFVL